jgi:hypothetical protein
MKFIKVSLISVSVAALLSSSLSAGWVIVNEDGSTTPYTEDCCRAPVKVVKRVKRKKRVCNTCDLSKYPEAETLPLEPGEKLAPATLRGCPSQR